MAELLTYYKTPERMNKLGERRKKGGEGAERVTVDGKSRSRRRICRIADPQCNVR
jgi:hypothetical protein